MNMRPILSCGKNQPTPGSTAGKKTLKQVSNAGVLLLVAMLTGSGCATKTTIDRTVDFANAGSDFSDTIDPVLKQSLEAKVRANSLTLRLGRKATLELCGPSDTACIDSAQNDLADALVKDTQNLQSRAKLYRRIRAHGQVLRNYFQTLSSLASSSEPETLGKSAQELVTKAATLRKDILANPLVKPFDLGDVPTILITQVADSFKSKSLKKVLKATAPAISTELELLSQLLGNLADQTSADLALESQVDDDKNINDPFFESTGALPDDWADRRLKAIQRELDLNTVDAAHKAAGTLQTTFEALVENRLDPSSLSGLISDLDKLATLALEVQRVRDEKKGDES